MTFTKTDELPCKSTDALVGKSFTYDDVSEAHYGNVVTFINHIPYNDRIIISEYSEPGRWGNGIQQYYVYLPPLIYHTTLHGGVYGRDGEVFRIGEITESTDGTITYKKIR